MSAFQSYLSMAFANLDSFIRYSCLVRVALLNLSRYSLGVQLFCCLNARLKVEILGKPDCRAISVIERFGCSNNAFAANNRLLVR